jgi:gliding motility-associated-like protein
MRKQFLLLLTLCVLCTYVSNAQNYYIGTNGVNNGSIVNTCVGNFYDDGGPGSNYNQNQDYTITFKPDNPFTFMQIKFIGNNPFLLGTGAQLFIYDGMSVNDTLLNGSALNANSNNIITDGFAFTASDTNTSHALTIRFISTSTDPTAAGWVAQIRCVPPCQKIFGAIQTNPPKTGNYLNICPNDRVTFSFIGSYPQNNQGYVQADYLNKYIWNFTGRDSVTYGVSTVARNFPRQGGYKIQVIVVDTNNCRNQTEMFVKVRTGIRPQFRFSGDTICYRDTFVIAGNVDTTSGYTTGSFGTGFINNGTFIQPPVSGDSIFLPDGSGVSYQTSIIVNQFLPTQTLTNVNQLRRIFAKLEHSYLGDLRISVIAPNGREVVLKAYPGGGNCFLGEPVDQDNLPNVRGVGYEYSWGPVPTYRRMVDETGTWTQTYTDNSGFTYNNHAYLKAGIYRSEGALSALIGTPLNGNWTLKFTDNLAIDNGYLFDWGLEFDPALYPNPETYSVPMASYNWLPAPGLISVAGFTATVSPPLGTTAYTFAVRDTFGCRFDTTVNVIVNPLPLKPNLGADTTICTGQIIALNVLNPQAGVSYQWSNGTNGVSTSVNAIGNYNVIGTDNNGCRNRDSIQVIFSQLFRVSLGTPTQWCATSPALLTANVTGSGANVVNRFVWQDNSANRTFLTPSPGRYYVTAYNNIGCYESDTITLVDNLINHYFLPNDTTICDKSAFTYNLNTPVPANILWQDNSTGYTYTVRDSGYYSITATTADGCKRYDTMKIGLRPLPKFNLGADKTLCKGFDQILNARYPGATYLWSNGKRDSSIIVTIGGDYYATATYNACDYQDTVKVTFVDCDCNPKLLNAFSPNGDGINDVWKPQLTCRPLNYDLQIFNRYGQRIILNENWRSNGWDGRVEGNDVPVGTYYYVFAYFDEVLKQQIYFKGSITVLR